MHTLFRSSPSDVFAGVLAVVDAFDSTMNMEQAKAFLSVVCNPGQSVIFHAKRLNISHAVMSKRIDLMCEFKSKGAPGKGLLTSRPNPMDRRLTEIKLAPADEALVARLMRLMGGDNLI